MAEPRSSTCSARSCPPARPRVGRSTRSGNDGASHSLDRPPAITAPRRPQPARREVRVTIVRTSVVVMPLFASLLITADVAARKRGRPAGALVGATARRPDGAAIRAPGAGRALRVTRSNMSTTHASLCWRAARRERFGAGRLERDAKRTCGKSPSAGTDIVRSGFFFDKLSFRLDIAAAPLESLAARRLRCSSSHRAAGGQASERARERAPRWSRAPIGPSRD